MNAHPVTYPAGAALAATEVVLRRLDSAADYAAAVELQRLTWGASFQDVVPAAILKVTQRVGGVSAGAFGPDGQLYGFVYGLTGLRDGVAAHWSHMLAVRREARNLGIGRRLKEYQRQLLQEAGVEWMYWTFDPLVARNAHLNINRLHVEVSEYVPDMYGDTGSQLHAFGTDRFVVMWPVRSAPVSNGRSSNTAPLGDARVLNAATDAELRGLRKTDAPLRVEVPTDVESLSVADARAWRNSSRRAFLAALHSGLRVSGFYTENGHSFYVLTE